MEHVISRGRWVGGLEVGNEGEESGGFLVVVVVVGVQYGR